MTAVLVDSEVTPLSVDDLLRALVAGYRLTVGSDPSPRVLACIGAQVCLETGNGAKMRDFNPGNKKRPKDWDGLFAYFPCDEIFDGQTARRARILGPCEVHPWHDAADGSARFRVVLPAGHPWAAFCAFPSAVEGMADYVDMLSRNFPAAWTRAFAGDADGFSRALGAARYYTADVSAYTAGLVSIAHRIAPACGRLIAGDFGISDEDREHIESQVMLTLNDARFSDPEPFPLGAA